MIFNTKKPHVLSVEGLTITCHIPDAVEQAQFLDTLMSDERKGVQRLPMLALALFTTTVDNIEGLTDEEGAEIPFARTEDYVRGFPLKSLRAISDAIQELTDTPLELKKKSLSPEPSTAEPSEAILETSP